MHLFRFKNRLIFYLNNQMNWFSIDLGLRIYDLSLSTTIVVTI